MAIAKRLKELRKLRNYSQEGFANKIGVKHGTYRNWEQGINDPDGNTMVIIADILNTTTDYLFGLTDQRDKIPSEYSPSDDSTLWLMDRIAKADKYKVDQLKKLWEVIDGESKED